MRVALPVQTLYGGIGQVPRVRKPDQIELMIHREVYSRTTTTTHGRTRLR